ncbi:hypothetical protein Q757_02380 [Oenococcus alcoholitolerans]|uniref:PRD domain-containing protein n=1 Tax=Oenococcus alcoholitolerans TaxID=931074 RepID=A0ABR4XRU4_9LACO|nr:hypothetical protein Q757_02380 [Oenococcus alcoholitolerans]
MKKLIETTLSNSLEIITVDYKQLYDLLKNHDKKFFANTRLIMTTTDINSEITEGSGTEIFNVYSVFDQKSSLKLQKVLRESGENQKSINSLIDKLLRFLSIEGIKGRLQILNPDIVIEDSQEIVKHYENFYDVKFDARLKLNLYMHISLMIERMIISRHLQQSTIDKTLLSSQEQDFFSLSSGIFQPLEQKFNITIQDHEIDLLYQLLKDYLS